MHEQLSLAGLSSTWFRIDRDAADSYSLIVTSARPDSGYDDATRERYTRLTASEVLDVLFAELCGRLEIT